MIIRNSKLVQFVILLIIFFSLYFGIEAADDNILWRFPALIAGLPGAINVFVEHLMYDWMPIQIYDCLLYTSPSPRDRTRSRMPSSA